MTTSSRRLGRTPGGFAAYLAVLQDLTTAPPAEVTTRAAG